MPEDRKDEFAAGVVGGGGLEAEEDELAGGLVRGGLGTEEMSLRIDQYVVD